VYDGGKYDTRVDAIMADIIGVQSTFLSQPDGEGFEFRGPEYTGTKWFGYGAGVATRLQDVALADAFSKAIHEIWADGTYLKLSNEWFGFDIFGD